MICYMARVLKVSSGTPFKSLWVGAHKKAVTVLVTTKAVDQCGHGVGAGRLAGSCHLQPPSHLSPQEILL